MIIICFVLYFILREEKFAEHIADLTAQEARKNIYI